MHVQHILSALNIKYHFTSVNFWWSIAESIEFFFQNTQYIVSGKKTVTIPFCKNTTEQVLSAKHT